jgi:hypothetical protein
MRRDPAPGKPEELAPLWVVEHGRLGEVGLA